jgi:hypothetical protein
LTMTNVRSMLILPPLARACYHIVLAARNKGTTA